MTRRLEDSVSKTLDGTPEVLPFLPELLQDLWSLGSPPERSLALLRPLGLPPGETRLLDLGCGKGAVSVRLAAELRFRAVGVDGCPEFLETARQKAVEFRVEALCEFVHADIRDFVGTARDFDVAILASVGNVLGGPRETVERLRGCVRPGGYLLIDDGYLKSRGSFHHFRPRGETLRELLAHGDELVREVENPDDEIARINESYLRDIRKRARSLMARRPELAPRLREYLRSQEQECASMSRHFRGATWLIRRVEPAAPMEGP
jgi:SAM-dependent methyltransferase